MAEYIDKGRENGTITITGEKVLLDMWDDTEPTQTSCDTRDKEQYIREIERKLSSQVPLSCLEIKTVIAALRESNQCYQEPYYEVVYHDKYGKCQSRIMNPEYQSKTKEMPGGDVCIVSERFSIDFNRLVRDEDLE